MVIIMEGRRMIRFHDPYQLAENGIALDAAMAPFLRMLDGHHDLRDIQLAFMKQSGGRIVPLSDIESFLQRLDSACLLESEFFRDRLSRLRSDFMSRRTREPVHAGKAYPSEPEELGRFIDEGERALAEKQPEPAENLRGRSVTGVLAPHIDVQAAREAYVSAYRHLRGRPFETVIVFGVNHLPQEGLYCVSEKNFATPFGVLRTDRDFVSELLKRVPEGTFDGSDFGHRMEHSIEFQTIFLHHYLGGSISLVPILCGGIHEYLLRKESPFEDPRFRKMVEAMKNLLEERKGSVLLAAGVDLSHVGQKFGDPVAADTLLPAARSFETRMLAHIARGEPEKIFEMAAQNLDRFRVCGLPAILIFSSLTAGSRGALLCHETCDERVTGSAVNYASMVFTRENESGC